MRHKNNKNNIAQVINNKLTSKSIMRRHRSKAGAINNYLRLKLNIQLTQIKNRS